MQCTITIVHLLLFIALHLLVYLYLEYITEKIIITFNILWHAIFFCHVN